MKRAFGSALAFAIAALTLVVAAIATDMLPTECGAIGRPNVDILAVVTLVGGGLLWLSATITALGARAGTATRRRLFAVAVPELACWIAALVFYLHQTGGSYPNCG